MACATKHSGCSSWAQLGRAVELGRSSLQASRRPKQASMRAPAAARTMARRRAHVSSAAAFVSQAACCSTSVSDPRSQNSGGGGGGRTACVRAQTGCIARQTAPAQLQPPTRHDGRRHGAHAQQGAAVGVAQRRHERCLAVQALQRRLAEAQRLTGLGAAQHFHCHWRLLPVRQEHVCTCIAGAWCTCIAGPRSSAASGEQGTVAGGPSNSGAVPCAYLAKRAAA